MVPQILRTTGSGRNQHARIDGFTIKSADTGGGIVVNGYANTLDISNNRISNNSGFYGGGIRVGHPILTNEHPDGGLAYTDAENDFVAIHHNQVVFNGGQGGVGGGISMCTGADSYAITENWVCGNFSLGDGGGIGHTGVSDGSWDLFQVLRGRRQRPVNAGGQNQCIDGRPGDRGQHASSSTRASIRARRVSGGGIFIGGAQPAADPRRPHPRVPAT